MFTRIVLANDFLRPGETNWAAGASSKFSLFADECFVSIMHASPLPVEIVGWEESRSNRIYDQVQASRDLKGWAKVYDADLDIGSMFKDAFVIGVDLPSSISRHIKAGVQFNLSPYRLYWDRLWDTDAQIDDISDVSVHQSAMEWTGGYRMPIPGPAPKTLLVALQAATDGSLICGGRFWNERDLVAGIERVADQYEQILVRHHPVRKEFAWMSAVMSAFPHAKQTDVNPYRLMGLKQVHGVVSLSSSLLREASLFDCAAHRIMPERKALPRRVDGQIATETFWRRLFARHMVKPEPA